MDLSLPKQSFHMELGFPKQFFRMDSGLPQQFFHMDLGFPKQFFHMDLGIPKKFFHVDLGSKKDFFNATLDIQTNSLLSGSGLRQVPSGGSLGIRCSLGTCIYAGNATRQTCDNDQHLETVAVGQVRGRDVDVESKVGHGASFRWPCWWPCHG